MYFICPYTKSSFSSRHWCSHIAWYLTSGRWLPRDQYHSQESVDLDLNQEGSMWHQQNFYKLPHYTSAAAESSSISSLSSMSNVSSLGSVSGDVGTRSSALLRGEWNLPPVRRWPHTSASLEQVRRISRSLSFLLGESEQEGMTKEPSPPPAGLSYTLPPLSPHMPPLLTRTATSPQFPGQA